MIQDVSTLTVEEALAELEKRSPNAPFLALGQTVFWDEPMKGGVALTSKALGYGRRLVAGVHDTDYFAKLPSGRPERGAYCAVPHNDTTTRGLWSAAAEFSALLGSETVVSREMLHHGGLNVRRLQQARPDILDEATEAWGWRGIVSLQEHPPVSSEVPMTGLYPELARTFEWALQESLGRLEGGARARAAERAEAMRELVRTAYEAAPGQSLSEFYRRLLPEFYRLCSNQKVDLDATSTSELLRFNAMTCLQPRFDLLSLFVNEETRERACAAYDRAIAGTGLYELQRFGTGAIPFDLVIPGMGRGTLRLTRHALIVMTPHPQFATLEAPLRSLSDLAGVVEAKFGTQCVLVGKAVTLIGMLAREFVFVFHEGASGYVRHSRALHRMLAEEGMPLELAPILRVRYGVWDALKVCSSWMRLPGPFQRPFGAEEISAPSLAARWRNVALEQRALLARLGEMRRPVELIQFLESALGGSWRCLAQQYEDLHRRLETPMRGLEALRAKRQAAYVRIRELKARRVEAERAMGDHFRARIFEKHPSAVDLEERERLWRAAREAAESLDAARAEVKALLREQAELARDRSLVQIHEERRSIELEAELKRLSLIREAVICSEGMEKANHRPSAWWFPLICPFGNWFRRTVESAEYYLEPLI